MHKTLLLLCSSTLLAPVGAAPLQGGYLAPFLGPEQATFEWGGLRQQLSEEGYEFSVRLYERLGSIVAGGREQTSSEFTFLDAATLIDLDSVAGIPGDVMLRLNIQRGGDGLTDEVGAIQGLDGLELDSGIWISEAWYRWTSAEERVNAYVGKVDAQRVFANIQAGRGTLHDAYGFDNVMLPLHPDTAMGVMLEHRFPGGLYAGLGFFDAQDGGLTSARRGLSADFDENVVAVEVGYDWTGRGDAAVGRAGLGFWMHSGDFATRTGGVDEGQEGGYAWGEQELWRGGGAAADAPSLNVFGQFNWASKDVFAVSHQIGAGFKLLRHLPHRPLDETGVFASMAYIRDQPQLERELALEGFHRLQALPSLAVVPAVQWIIEPSGTGTDSIVLKLGLELTL